MVLGSELPLTCNGPIKVLRFFPNENELSSFFTLGLKCQANSAEKTVHKLCIALYKPVESFLW